MTAASADDPHDLARFVAAQDADGTYAAAVAELRAGAKSTHWMWFVFPQIAGLGQSPTSRYFAIRGVDEARAYRAHPVLAPRLIECAAIVAASTAPDAVAIFGSIDAQKLQSSMTLFNHAAPAEAAFSDVLRRYFAGERDDATLRLL